MTDQQSQWDAEDRSYRLERILEAKREQDLAAEKEREAEQALKNARRRRREAGWKLQSLLTVEARPTPLLDYRPPPQPVPPPTPPKENLCRVCGCTEETARQRMTETGEVIQWAEPDLCARCAASPPLQDGEGETPAGEVPQKKRSRKKAQ